MDEEVEGVKSIGRVVVCGLMCVMRGSGVKEMMEDTGHGLKGDRRRGGRRGGCRRKGRRGDELMRGRRGDGAGRGR